MVLIPFTFLFPLLYLCICLTVAVPSNTHHCHSVSFSSSVLCSPLSLALSVPCRIPLTQRASVLIIINGITHSCQQFFQVLFLCFSIFPSFYFINSQRRQIYHMWIYHNFFFSAEIMFRVHIHNSRELMEKYSPHFIKMLNVKIK